MGIYPRQTYWWKNYPKDETGTIPRKPCSTRIHVDAPTKAQRDQNRRDAEFQFAQDMIDIRKGLITPTMKAPQHATYADWITAHYLTQVTAHHRGREKEASMLRRLVQAFGPLAIAGFTAEIVDAYRQDRRRTVKVSTINREMQVLRSSLRRWATALRKAGSAAPDARDILADLEHRRPEETETRWFSESEFARFIEAIASHDSILGTPRLEGLALATTAVETCLRRSSLLKLTWVNYRQTHLVPLNAKQKISRSPITPNMRMYLDALPKDTARIFASHDRVAQRAQQRGFIMTEAQRLTSALAHVDRWFREVCTLAGLPCGRAAHGLTFHSFRHTGATWLLNGSETRRPVSVRVVMDLGGWRNVRVFMETYCHTSAADVDAAAASLFRSGLPGLALVQPAQKTA